MTAVFTDFFRTLLFDSLDKTEPLDHSANLMAGRSLHWVYFRNHAAFSSTQDARYTGVKTVSDLAGKPGWSTPSPQTATQVVGCTTASENTYVVANNPFANGANWTTSTVSAGALVLEGDYDGTTDPIIFLTDTPFEGGVTMHRDDSLIARPVPALAGNRSLFSWPVWFTGQTQVLPVEGSLAMLQAPPEFESAYTQHAWLYPQRVNMVANPSFETQTGTNHWRSGGTFTKVLGTEALPVSPGGGTSNAAYGRFVGTAPLVVESNLFPLTHRGTERDLWTIQAMVRGTGKVRVGLLGWEPDFLATYADWGDKGDVAEVWDIPAKGWLHIYALRRSAENTWGMVRIECDGGEMHLDNVLCEADWLRDWRYFDGDSTYGSRGDYSWYGGSNRKGRTYSCWYNHRRAVIGRLFAWDIQENDFVVTDEEVLSQGFVYRWVPAGVRVEAHYDVLWPDDTQEVVPDNSGTTVTPYDNGTNGGVPSAWASSQYLDPATGTASTPDTPADALGEFTIAAKLKVGTMSSSTKIIANQRLAATEISWAMSTANDNFMLQVSSNGTAFTFNPTPEQQWGHLPAEYAVAGKVIEVAVSLWKEAAQHILVTWLKITRPGENPGWEVIGMAPVDGALVTLFDSTAAIMVGGQPGGTPARYDAAIHWVEMRAGRSPDDGAVLWRFDAAGFLPGGTTFVESGRTWTLTSAAAIKRAF